MPEQANTRARQKAVLDAAATHLEQGDTGAYWRAISRISPRYGRLAGMVAGNEGFLATGARERLQDAAEEALGRRFTEAEMDGIEIDIARLDHQIRHANLAATGQASISLGESDRYHAAVFARYDLPAEAYTFHNMAKALGPIADAVRDTDDPRDPDAKARFDDAVKRHRPALGERLRNNAAVIGDMFSFVSDVIEGYGHDFAGWSGDRLRMVRDMLGAEVLPAGRNGGKRSERPTEPAGRHALIDSLTRVDDDVDLVLLKAPAALTEGEVRQVMARRQDTRDEAERQRLFRVEQDHFDHVYGVGPVRRDATGRLAQPEAVNPARRTPAPVLAAGGAPLHRSLGAVAGRVADLSDELGGMDAVKSLQRGLNILAEWSGRDPADRGNGETGSRREHPFPAVRLFARLKDDGVAGPKTRGALRAATAAFGGPRVEEGLALGRFHGFAREVAATGGDVKQAAEAAFGPLFRRPGAGAGRARPEGFGLQMAVNDLGRELLGAGFRPLQEDGDIGPRTTDAFRAVLAAAGPDRFTRQLGRSMGFLGDGDGAIDAA